MNDFARRTLHASCVAIGDRGVLILGESGKGKSDLALRLIDRGAMLVADDYSELWAADGRVRAAVPATIAGRIEVRGLGIVTMPWKKEIELSLVVRLVDDPPRFPDDTPVELVGIALPAIAISAREPSAPIKVELALSSALEGLR